MGQTDIDVSIIGGGPAGLAIATACAEQGLKVEVTAPDLDRPWSRRFGAWQDEVTLPWLQQCVDDSWVAPQVWTSERSTLLNRRYVHINTPKLQRTLQQRCIDHSVTLTQGIIRDLDHQPGHTRLLGADGSQSQSRLVIDASGAAARFVERPNAGPPPVQVAYGQLLEVDEHPWFEGEMVLMDFRPVGEEAGEGPPSFLYALPLGKHQVFVEETSLISRPAIPLPLLQSRLHRRLRQLGVRPRKVLEEERCRIPMVQAIPSRNQRVVGFGVSASMVHPATGYQLARTLGKASGVAQVITQHLDGGPDAAAHAAWRAIWPTDEIRAWELYTFGAQFLASLNPVQTRRFFDGFFSLSDDDWQGFLSARLTTLQLARVMTQVFGHLDGPLRWDLMRAGASMRGMPLFRAATALS